MIADLQQTVKSLNYSQLAPPIFLVAILAMMTLPLPVILLDVFFSFNIALSLLVLLVSLQTLRPVEFAIFPTVLLVATLLRLALNIASTRIVLLEGHQGGDAAGKVIEAFGEVLIGGNYAVGLVVFLILIIINFMVVTKGAGRISEVTARFTLDAMPGKQMAIDADLNAGLIDQTEAKARRADIAEEADFYGAMDGASKFVRGDAVAGILILLINLIGGLAIGVAQHDLGFADAMQKYALLTIGDGLVAQVPSLLLSVSAAIMVTRVNSAQDLSNQVRKQMLNSPDALMLAAGVLGVLGIVPGMPHLSFLTLAGACVGLSVFIQKRPLPDDQGSGVMANLGTGNSGAANMGSTGNAQPIQGTLESGEPISGEVSSQPKELGWDDVQPVDLVGLEVGYRLIGLVDDSQEGDLLTRVRGVRKKLSQEMGFLMPTVHIRDNLELLPTQYRITLKGVTVAEAEIHVDRELAINPGQVFGNVPGIPGKDPAFGLDAIWIEAAQKDQAQNLGYTVVDPSTVIATHINHVMQTHADELLGFEELQKLLDQLSKKNAKLVENVVPQPISLSTLLSVLQMLLREQIPIKDLRTILEALSQVSDQAQNHEALVSAARLALSRMIVHGLTGPEQELKVMTLQPELEQILTQAVFQAKQNGGKETDATIELTLAKKLQESVANLVTQQEMQGLPPVLLVASGIRNMLARFLRYGLAGLSVLSYNEIPEGKNITVIAQIGQS